MLGSNGVLMSPSPPPPRRMANALDDDDVEDGKICPSLCMHDVADGIDEYTALLSRCIRKRRAVRVFENR